MEKNINAVAIDIYWLFLWQLPNLIATRTVLLGHYTVSSTNPVIAEVGNEGATTIEGVSEAHAAGKDKRRLRSYVHLYRLHLCQLSNNSLLTARA